MTVNVKDAPDHLVNHSSPRQKKSQFRLLCCSFSLPLIDIGYTHRVVGEIVVDVTG